MKNDKATAAAALKKIFATMDAGDAQEVRQAYYKAAEGLLALYDALDKAMQAEVGPEAQALFDQQKLVIRSQIELNKMALGIVL